MSGREDITELIPFAWVDSLGKAVFNLPPLKEFLPPKPSKVAQDVGLPTLESLPTPTDLYNKLPKPSTGGLNLPKPPLPPPPF